MFFSVHCGAQLTEECSWIDNSLQFALIGDIDVSFVKFLIPLYTKQGGLMDLVDSEGWKIDDKLKLLKSERVTG